MVDEQWWRSGLPGEAAEAEGEPRVSCCSAADGGCERGRVAAATMTGPDGEICELLMSPEDALLDIVEALVAAAAAATAAAPA